MSVTKTNIYELDYDGLIELYDTGELFNGEYGDEEIAEVIGWIQAGVEGYRS